MCRRLAVQASALTLAFSSALFESQMKACTRPAHRGTRTLAALHATAGLWRAPTNVYTPIAVFDGLGNADGLPAPLQILTESAPNPVDAPFSSFPAEIIAGNCKTAANQPSSTSLLLRGELEEVQMLDAWGEDDIDVGKVAS